MWIGPEVNIIVLRDVPNSSEQRAYHQTATLHSSPDKMLDSFRFFSFEILLFFL